MNNISLSGRLCADPELRYTSQGTAVTNFNLAVDRDYRSRDVTTDFITIVCWDKVAEYVAQYFPKGRLIELEGRLQTRNYEYKGQRRKATEVVARKVRSLESGATIDETESYKDFDDDEENPLPF